MKTLLLLRHGKSDWDANYDGDHQRPLSKRGVRSAHLMGRLISGMGLAPDRVISSTALRAAATARAAAEAGEWETAIEYDDGFYGGDPDKVLERAAKSTGERLLLVGHDPTWSMLVSRLTGASAEMKTASLAVVELHIDEWSALPDARGVLSVLLNPRRFFNSPWDPGA